MNAGNFLTLELPKTACCMG